MKRRNFLSSIAIPFVPATTVSAAPAVAIVNAAPMASFSEFEDKSSAQVDHGCTQTIFHIDELAYHNVHAS